MQFQYRIYHREEGKQPIEQVLHPFTENQQASEYSSLPTFLSIRLSASGIIAKFPITEIELDGVIVVLVSDKPENEVYSELARSLSENKPLKRATPI